MIDVKMMSFSELIERDIEISKIIIDMLSSKNFMQIIERYKELVREQKLVWEELSIRYKEKIDRQKYI